MITYIFSKCARPPIATSARTSPRRSTASRGWWSRRITLEHRLVYRVEGESLLVAQCRHHY
ncbi:MAG: type II toxin-antitoxin system YoeB family toxin [Methylocystis sp.]